MHLRVATLTAEVVSSSMPVARDVARVRARYDAVSVSASKEPLK